jgi:hypothetical protein
MPAVEGVKTGIEAFRQFAQRVNLFTGHVTVEQNAKAT